MNRTFLLLGSNEGDRMAFLNMASEKINELIGPVISVSRVYETEPWGFESKAFFLNRVLEVNTDLNPQKLLEAVLTIEAKLGRVRTAKGYHSRLIDIDILFYNSDIIQQKDLMIPHPRISERRFTLLPLNELAAEFVHPQNGSTVSELLAYCADTSKVILYKSA